MGNGESAEILAFLHVFKHDDHRMGGVNEVALPTKEIIDSLSNFAEPGYYGTIELELSLLTSASSHVKIVASYNHVTRPDPTSPRPEFRDSTKRQQARAERMDTLRRLMCENSQKFRILCPVVSIKGVFQDGVCSQLQVVEREQLSIGTR